MTTKQLILRTLSALLSAPGDPEMLALQIGASVREVEAAVEHLDRKGLAESQRTRLTMQGLAAAVVIQTHESPVDVDTSTNSHRSHFQPAKIRRAA